MLFFTSNINPMKKKNAKLLTTNSSITNKFLQTLLDAPSILIVEKYTFLDFKIIFIMKYDTNNNKYHST